MILTSPDHFGVLRGKHVKINQGKRKLGVVGLRLKMVSGGLKTKDLAIVVLT